MHSPLPVRLAAPSGAGPLGAPLLTPLAAALSARALPWPVAHRALEVVLLRLDDPQQAPGLAASWLLTLLFGQQHGQLVLTPDGDDITADPAWHRALVDSALPRLQRLGGPGALLRVLAAPLAGLPLADAATAGQQGHRMQRYAFVQLCAAAAGEQGGERQAAPGLAGVLAGPLLAVLPRAAVLSALELEAELAAAAAGGSGSGSHGVDGGSGGGPLLRLLLTAAPQLGLQALQALAAVTGEAAGAGGGAARAFGTLPATVVAAAAPRLAQAVAKHAPCRGALLQQREEVVGAVRALGTAVAALPAGTAADGESAAEVQRLVQCVADLLALPASALAP